MISLHLEFLVSFTSLIEQVSLYSIVKKPEITLITLLYFCQKKHTRLRFRNTISVKSQSRSFFNEFRKCCTSFYFMPERIETITIRYRKAAVYSTVLHPSSRHAPWEWCIDCVSHFIKPSRGIPRNIPLATCSFFSDIQTRLKARAYTSGFWDFQWYTTTKRC